MDSKYENFTEKSSHNGTYVFLLVVNACMGSFFFGYTLGVFNPIQKYIQTNVYPDIPTWLLYFATSLVPLGAGIGAVTSGSISSNFGRKKAMIITDLIAAVGVAVQLLNSQYLLVLGRLICGYCVGLNSALVPTYVSEVSPVKVKGLMGTFNQLFICIGVLIAFFLGFGLPKGEDNSGSQYWRFMLGLPLATLALRTFLLTTVFNLDTPKYLIMNDKPKEARKILEKIYGSQADEQQSLLQKEKDSQDGQSKVTVKDLFSPRYKKRFIAGAGLSMLQQLSGINAIIFFSTAIFENQANGNENLPTIYTAIVGIVNVLSALAAGPIVTKAGRKAILSTGTILCGITLAGFGILSSMTNDKSPLLPYFIFAYMVAFGFSLGPVVWLYIPEVLPDAGVSIAVLLNWVVAFMVAQGFPTLQEFAGTGISFILFAAFCALGIVFIGTYVKETKGKTDAEITAMFSGDKNIDDSNQSLTEA